MVFLNHGSFGACPRVVRDEYRRWQDELERRFAKRHEWQGTRGPAAYLAVPAAIAFQREYGWGGVRARCHALAADFVATSGLECFEPYARWSRCGFPRATCRCRGTTTSAA